MQFKKNWKLHLLAFLLALFVVIYYRSYHLKKSHLGGFNLPSSIEKIKNEK